MSSKAMDLIAGYYIKELYVIEGQSGHSPQTYDNLAEVKAKHPNKPVLYGFQVVDGRTGRVPDGCSSFVPSIISARNEFVDTVLPRLVPDGTHLDYLGNVYEVIDQRDGKFDLQDVNSDYYTTRSFRDLADSIEAFLHPSLDNRIQEAQQKRRETGISHSKAKGMDVHSI